MIVVRKRIFDQTNNWNKAAILSKLAYWFDLDSNGAPRAKIWRNGKLWVAKTNSDWWEECRVKSRTARRMLNEMENDGIIIKTISKFSGKNATFIRPGEKFSQVTGQSVEHCTREKTSQSGQNGQVEPAKMDTSYTINTNNNSNTLSGKDNGQKETGENNSLAEKAERSDEQDVNRDYTKLIDKIDPKPWDVYCLLDGMYPGINKGQTLAEAKRMLNDQAADMPEIYQAAKAVINDQWRIKNGVPFNASAVRKKLPVLRQQQEREDRLRWTPFGSLDPKEAHTKKVWTPFG